MVIKIKSSAVFFDFMDRAKIGKKIILERNLKMKGYNF
jgi:hypothetical protein